MVILFSICYFLSVFCFLSTLIYRTWTDMLMFLPASVFFILIVFLFR